jgi:hypothetical protein
VGTNRREGERRGLRGREYDYFIYIYENKIMLKLFKKG